FGLPSSLRIDTESSRSVSGRALHRRRGGRVPDTGDEGGNGQPLAPSPFSRSLFALLLWTVTVAGAAVLVAAVVGMVDAGDVAEPVALVALASLVVFGELRPVVTSRSYGEGTTPSIAFTFAIMFLWGPWPAILAQALATPVADLTARKSWWRVTVNPAQYALS